MRATAAVPRTDSAPAALLLPAPAQPGVERTPSGEVKLPAWPLLAMLYGLPVFWVAGLTLFVPVAFGSIMALFLLMRGGLRATPEHCAGWRSWGGSWCARSRSPARWSWWDTPSAPRI